MGDFPAEYNTSKFNPGENAEEEKTKEEEAAAAGEEQKEEPKVK